MSNSKKNKKKEEEAFTLAELLVVVGIIAVLVAIAIPVFQSQLEKAREAADISSIRNAYAQMMLNATDGSAKADDTMEVELLQKMNGWDSLVITWPNNFSEVGSPFAKGKATVSYAISKGMITGCKVTYQK